MPFMRRAFAARDECENQEDRQEMTASSRPADWTPSVTEPGLRPDLSAIYHGHRHTPSRALSYSGIKILLNETPLDFITPKERKSEEMGFGTIVHKLALGKGAMFEISPFDDYRTKDARQWRDDCIAMGHVPIKADKFADARKMADIIQERIKRALDGALYETEVPFFWKDGDVWFSGMMDVWCAELNTVIDPKTTGNVHQFDREITKFGYHIQSALYRRGLDHIFPDNAGRHKFKILPIATEAPYVSRLISISEAWRAGAESDIAHAVRIFAECERTGFWPGYPDEETMDEPSWMMKLRIEREMMESDDE